MDQSEAMIDDIRKEREHCGRGLLSRREHREPLPFHDKNHQALAVARTETERQTVAKSGPATIWEYFEETHPSEVRELLIEAHQFLQDNLLPFATCGIKWRLPFYTLNRNFCYLNRHPDHITLGFSFGYRLLPLPGILLDENGALKHIRYLELFSVVDLYSETVNGILQEALIIDEMFGRRTAGTSTKRRPSSPTMRSIRSSRFRS